MQRVTSVVSSFKKGTVVFILCWTHANSARAHTLLQIIATGQQAKLTVLIRASPLSRCPA